MIRGDSQFRQFVQFLICRVMQYFGLGIRSFLNVILFCLFSFFIFVVVIVDQMVKHTINITQTTALFSFSNPNVTEPEVPLFFST